MAKRKQPTKQRAPSKSKKKPAPKKQQPKRSKGPGLFARLRGGWKRLKTGVPPWLDEIAAVLLVVFGLVSLLILLGLTSEDAWLAMSWRDTLWQLFGPVGGLLIAAGIGTVGLLFLLPRMGAKITVPWDRVLAGEFAFAASLALMHLLSPGAGDPRALAEVGEGGGYIGWALSQAVSTVVGPAAAALFWGVILLLTAAAALGVRRRWVRVALTWVNRRARRLAYQIDPDASPALPAAVDAAGAETAQSAALPEPKPEKKKKQKKPRREREAHARPKLSSPGMPGERESVVPRGEDAPLPPQYLNNNGGEFVVIDHTDVRKVRKRPPRLPPLEILEDIELGRPGDKELAANARTIEETLGDFDIDAQVVGVKIGPTVTQYAVQPFREVEDEEGNLQLQRVRIRKIASLAGDLALALEVERLRIQAPVPGTNYVGIEVPNRAPGVVALRPLLESEEFYKANRPLAVPLGRDVSGSPLVIDLGRMPHLLIAGTTGSGKSVCITAMAAALLMNNTPDDLRLVMLDPKMVELMRFNGVPHLLGPVETDIERSIGVLYWATREMDRRYRLLEEESARNIEIYNRKLGKARADEHMPYIVILIDEIGDLMLSMPDETEQHLCRLAQMARAVGMHLVVATQRPSTDIITGLIKANFPARMSFAVTSGVDSRVILDTVGAENLLGRGDMLFLAPDAAGTQRVQGTHMDDDELERLVDFWVEQYQAAIDAGEAEPPARLPPWERGLTRREVLAQTDELLEEAIELVVHQGRASTSLVQRRLNIGYPRAARIMGYLEELGIVGKASRGGRSRPVLIKPGEDMFHLIAEQKNKSKGTKR
jgi:S-DNA-T family DNA segregation ATPase FtsK/SpoIIIE